MVQVYTYADEISFDAVLTLDFFVSGGSLTNFSKIQVPRTTILGMVTDHSGGRGAFVMVN